MSIDEFMQTKLFGLLFSLFCLVVYGYLLYLESRRRAAWRKNA